MVDLPIDQLSDNQLIEKFKKNPVDVARELIKNQQQLYRFWRLVEVRSLQDPTLVNAYDKSQKILAAATPLPQPKPTTPSTQEIPEYKPLFEDATKQNRNPINEQNAEAIKSWLNNLKPGFLEYMAKVRGGYEAKKLENLKMLERSGQNITQAYQEFLANEQVAAQSAVGFSQHLWNYLTMYRGQLVGFYIDEAAWELIFSALGPVGNMMRTINEKKLSWKMAWMKNFLNPNAIQYYLYSMPTMMAYDVLKYPGRAIFSILEAGGAPLLSKVHVPEWHYDKKQGMWEQKIEQKVVFSPLFRAIQASHTVAGRLDQINGLSFDKKRFSSWQENINSDFSEALLSKDKRKLNQLLKKYDGSIFRHALANTARRLKSTERDPLSFLAALLAGTIWDFTLGLAVNTVRLAVTKVLGYIPGVNALRGQLIKFLTSNKWLQTASMGRVTGASFFKGTFSMTTASSTYGGAWLGTQLAKILGISTLPAQIIGGGIGAIAGSIYTTALKLSAQGNLPAPYNPITWTRTFQDLRYAAEGNTLARFYAQNALDQTYMKGGRGLFAKGFGLEPLSLRPGPIMRLASWLNRNWLVRLPINGFVWKDILLRVLPPELLGVKILGIPLGGIINWLPAIDYFWQIKGNLFKVLTKPSVTVFGRTFTTPYYRMFSLQNPSSFMSSVAQRLRFQWLKIGYGEPAGFLYEEKAWLQNVNKFLNNLSRVFKTAQPFAQNFFNPGFFMGFGISPLLTSTFGAWAYVVGPAAGSIGWLAATGAAASIAGMPTGVFMARFNPLAWAGYFIGQLTGLAIFGSSIPFWYTAAWTVGVPMFGMGLNITFSMVAQAYGVTVSALVQGSTGLSSATIAGTLAIGATIASVLSIVALTVFGGWLIYAAFWVPTIERAKAGPESSNFSINDTIQQTAPNQYQLCSNFSITENVFNSERFLIHETDFRQTYLTVDLTSPEQTTDAWRNEPLDYTAFSPATIESNQYSIPLPINSPGEPPLVGAVSMEPVLQTVLSVPNTQKQNLFDLMSQNSSVVYTMKPFFDILINLAKERNQNPHLVTEYETQQVIIKEQKKLVDDLLEKAEDKNLSGAAMVANDYLNNNPLVDPCPDPAQTCPPDKQGLKQLFNSWPRLVNSYLTKISVLSNQPNPDFQSWIESLRQESKNLNQQIDLLPDIIDQIEDIKMTDEDAAKILDPNFNFLNFANMTVAEQNDVWDNLLTKHFEKVFNRNNTFYFIPKGTNYRVCAQTEYCYALDPANPPTCPTGQPISVCSTISYQPNFWSPSTSFATHCATFTP